MIRRPPRSTLTDTLFPYTTLVRSFDLIIGSDTRYERYHAERLSALLPRHAQRVCEVLITDPGRGNSAPFTRALAAQDFVLVERRCRMDEGDMPPFRGRLLSYARAEAAAGATQ